MKYDIIGDIHGCAKSLCLLLKNLGYKTVHGIYQKTGHQVIFLGDFIDRGPYQREVLQLVRPMMENGYALSIMGNHEFNAIAYATLNKDNTAYLRPHTDKNTQQHQAFLAAYVFNSDEYHEVIDWFKSLPLWLELDSIKAIHACWDNQMITKLEPYTQGQKLTHELLHLSCDDSSWQFHALETILKGKEIPLPENHRGFKDKDGHQRHHIRIKWWDKLAKNYREAYMGPESALTDIPDDKITGEQLIEYDLGDKPLFLGHYWLEGDVKPLTQNIACLDYSVAKPKIDARLVAYQYQGEKVLKQDHFIWVERQEN